MIGCYGCVGQSEKYFNAGPKAGYAAHMGYSAENASCRMRLSVPIEAYQIPLGDEIYKRKY